jgi:cytochrome c-type biogenesis protein CcmH
MRTNFFGGRSGSAAGSSIVAATAFLFVIGVGAVASYLRDASGPTAFDETVSSPLPSSDSADDEVGRLVNYARSIGLEEPAPVTAADDSLPDVNTMTERLAARLETAPEDVEGWTLLMRSRVVLGEKEVAAAAFRKALEVFKNDSEASDKITAAAIELGLKSE